MKKILVSFMAFLLILTLAGCSSDTFTVNSPYEKFKLKSVASIMLYGPDSTGASAEGIQQEISSGGAHYQQLVQLIQGDKLDTCETKNFGLCYAIFTFHSGDTTKVYPANDGSNYLCLYSLNEAVAKYLELPEEDMTTITSIFESYGIQVDYSIQ